MPAIVDRVAKRAEIVRHAADVFARHGYHATKMQDIATNADIGKGTIYEYFQTKEELFLAIYDSWMTEYEQTIRNRIAAAQDPMSMVDAIRESAVEFYESRAEQAPLLLEFWAHALRTDNPAFLDRVRRLRSYLRDLGTMLTRDLTASGWFNEIDAAAFAELDTGISDGIFLAWLMHGRDFPLGKAFTFRQSVIGLGLLTPMGRSVVEPKLSAKLKRGF
jgi:TetR/AcrR family fatty acid metabolism transcriptional regulator